MTPTCRYISGLGRTRAHFAWGASPPDLFAGVYFDRASGPIRPPTDDAWRVALDVSEITDRDAARWDEDDGERAALWLGRSLPLSRLVRDNPKVGDQAQAAASFVTRTFSDLVSARLG